MAIELNKHNQKHLIKISGDFDVTQAEDARQLFTQLLDTLQHDVDVDLKEVPFIDSSGIGAIVFLYKRLRCLGKEMSIINLQSQPLELIQLLRIDRIIKVI